MTHPSKPKLRILPFTLQAEKPLASVLRQIIKTGKTIHKKTIDLYLFLGYPEPSEIVTKRHCFGLI
ncbi:MAG: hypothetical protein EHJ94_10270 [Deltaproteobacteria bacterium]|nr:MAG: hypothetical protein EHJ94_10270 [Deltaproteobacteria bacterium]